MTRTTPRELHEHAVDMAMQAWEAEVGRYLTAEFAESSRSARYADHKVEGYRQAFRESVRERLAQTFAAIGLVRGSAS